MRSTARKQPPMPPRGASPAELKAWISACRAEMTPDEVREYEEAGDGLRQTFDALGFDPETNSFPSSSLLMDVDVSVPSEQAAST